MQKQFTSLLKEKSLSHVESYVRDSENIANQFIILSDLLERGDIVTALEKVMYTYFPAYNYYYNYCLYIC